MFIYQILLFTILISCNDFNHMLYQNWKKRTLAREPKVEDIDIWKDELAMEEEEILQLEKKIYKMVHKTRKAGSVAWKIAKTYANIGNYEMGIHYYNQALKDKINSEKPNVEVHFFESSIPYFEKALKYKPINDQILFETGLAYANAAKDMGWEKIRTQASIKIFEALLKRDPSDTRYPFELALLYFYPSIYLSDFDRINSRNFDRTKNIEKSFELLNQILEKEPNNIPTYFAKANFLYRLGEEQEALQIYFQIKKILERLKKEGIIQGDLEKYPSYINTLKNIQKIQK